MYAEALLIENDVSLTGIKHTEVDSKLLQS